MNEKNKTADSNGNLSLWVDEIRPLKIGFDGKYVIFYFRMMTESEEDAIKQRFRDIADEKDVKEKRRLQFEIIKSAVVEFSLKTPEIEDGESLKPIAEGTIAEAINTCFNGQTRRSGKVLENAYYLFVSKHEPDAYFL
jgi:hypothetical protein